MLNLIQVYSTCTSCWILCFRHIHHFYVWFFRDIYLDLYYRVSDVLFYSSF